MLYQLSLIVTVYQEGKIFRTRICKRCSPRLNLEEIGKTDKTGTEITFYPDETIFETTEFNYDTILDRLTTCGLSNKRY